jgi:hypothetical protein
MSLNLILSYFTFGQSNEFKTYSNGLIYSPTTMQKLNHVVDSLNLRFKQCDLHKTYYAKRQAKAHYFSLDGKKSKELQKDLDNKITWETLKAKYPKLKIDTTILITSYFDEQDNEVSFYGMRINKDYNYTITTKNTKILEINLVGQYIYEYSNYEKGSLEGFYFIENSNITPLHTPYARMVQYTECMVDTTTDIFTFEKDTEYNRWVECDLRDTLINQCHNYPYPNQPKAPEYDENLYYADFEITNSKDTIGNAQKRDSLNIAFKIYSQEYEIWDSLRWLDIRKNVMETPKYQADLKEYLLHLKKHKCSNERIEYLMLNYVSKEVILDLKRKRKVVGQCSQDDSPRRHAIEIAMLAAETAKWEIFLRSHLNVMNDRFARMSDGSYAWGQRQTYIRELEELGINVTDLLLGISLRVENPSQNHYFGTIWRIGKALAETRKADELEKKLETMIKDTELDDYNRLMMYYVFRNYNEFLVDETRKLENVAKIAEAVATLPAYLKDRLK